MATLKVDTITSDTLPTVSITDGASISGVTTFSSDINIADKIVHTGDTNTAIRFPGADTITAETGGTERVRINSSGNMGLGDLSNVSNNPQVLLHIASSSPTLRIQDTTNDFYGHISADDGGSLSFDSDAGNGAGSSKLVFKTDGSEHARITSAGNVGIGTDNPQVKLTVSSTSPAVCDIHHIDGGTNDESRIILGALANNPPSNRGAGIAALNNGAGHDLLIKCSASHSAGPTEKVRITSSGQLSTGAESAPDVSAGGLCLNQGAADTNIFSLKSSDIAHGVTTYDETDTYFSIRKSSGDKGGARIHGFTDAAGGDAALEFQGIINSDADQGYCPIEFRGSEANGTGVQNIAADRRILNIKNSDGTRIASFTGTGLTFGNDSATANALDDYEEGQWTVQLTGASSGTSNDGDSGTGFDTASGVYTKVGNTCYYTMHLANVHDGDCTGDLRFSLPFTAGNGQSSTSSLRTVGACVFSGVNYTASGQANVYIESGNAFAIIAETIDNTSLDFINVTNVDSDANDIYLSGFFFV